MTTYRLYDETSQTDHATEIQAETLADACAKAREIIPTLNWPDTLTMVTMTVREVVADDADHYAQAADVTVDL